MAMRSFLSVEMLLALVVLGQLLLCVGGVFAGDMERSLLNGAVFLLGFAAVRKTTPALAALYGLACALVLLLAITGLALAHLMLRDSRFLPLAVMLGFWNEAALVAKLEPILAMFGAILAIRLHCESSRRIVGTPSEADPLLFEHHAAADASCEATSRLPPPVMTSYAEGAARLPQPWVPPKTREPITPFRAIFSSIPSHAALPGRGQFGGGKSPGPAATGTAIAAELRVSSPRHSNCDEVI
mmetsp:Transcript_42062/g.116159  ORF Transcript_42062/g.116159 Transcript_42062/m.116159 type:complete len:242 (+) Transcript_42062:114-839(+)